MDYPIWSDSYKSWRVLGLLSDETACTGYRCKLPLMMLQRHGAQVNLSSVINPSMMADFDLMLAPRQNCKRNYGMFKYFSWYNKCIISDIDDDLHHVTQDNPAYSAYPKGGETIKGVEKILQQSHGVTVTTPELSRWYGRQNINIHEIDNYIDFSIRNWNTKVEFEGFDVKVEFKDLSKPSHREGKFVIGYSGGNSHAEDVKLIGPVLKKFLTDHRDALFVMYTSHQLFELFTTQFGLPMDQVEFVEPVPFMEHPPGLFGVDVHLAPLIVNQFTLSKSSLKLKEGLASGAAVIGTSIAPYARLHHEMPDLIRLVGKGPNCAESWYEALQNLKDDPTELERIKTEGRHRIFARHSLEVNFHKWTQTWAQIYQNSIDGKLGKPDIMIPEADGMAYGMYRPNDPSPLGEGKYKDVYPGAWG